MSQRSRFGRFGNVRRRPDAWASPHDRARARAAERLDGPLSSAETQWLDAHLAGCQACRAVAEAYAADRLLLRQLRDEHPEPPRDLWARTAAGIEREADAHPSVRRPPASRRGTSLPALSALSGLAVVGVVVVATAISSGLLGPTGHDDVAASPSIALASLAIPSEPTGIAVGAGKVHWLGADADGAFAYNVADIDVVCRLDRQPDCPQILDGNAKRVTLTATPKFVFQSPIDDQAVVMGTDAYGADAVIVVALPTPDPTPEPSSLTDPSASGTVDGPTETPASSPSDLVASSPPSSSALVVSPSELPAVSPSDLLPAGLVSASPSGSDATSPQPGDGAAIAIITDVTVVGRAAAYSPDGMWFAFSARPADGSAGPDIYVWHVGDLQARPITTDHASVFASWIGGAVLGSRIVVTPPVAPVDGLPTESAVVPPTIEAPTPAEVSPGQSPGQSPAPDPSASPTPVPEVMPHAFLVDPWTSAATTLIDGEWQPTVDPTGLAVVAWQGTVSVGVDGLTTTPATGNLVVHPFHGPLETDDPFGSPAVSQAPEVSPTVNPEPSVEISASLDPFASASLDPLASSSPAIMLDFPAQIVASGPIADFDARWDDTGSWLAIWIADPIDPALGRLSLLHFDPTTGLIDRPEGAPQDVTALPGFSIGFGRLAWASPPGQGGEGSRIQIAAWTDGLVGAVESIPVEGAIVVQ